MCSIKSVLWVLHIFTESAQSRYSLLVAMSVVDLCIPLLLIIHYAQTLIVSVFCHKIDYMICSKVISRMTRNRWKPRFPVDWRLLVEEHIANIGILLDIFLLLMFFFLIFCTHNFFCAYQTIVLREAILRKNLL